MINNKLTKKEAAQKWVSEFNAIPQQLIVKAYLENGNIDEITEITPIAVGDTVWNNEMQGAYIVSEVDRDSETVTIATEDGDMEVSIDDVSQESENDYLPMWGTMWTFGESLDEWWVLEQEGLQAMADCGFRVYETDELGVVFGVDGAGYDFYSEHWIPLYEARGLKWHDIEG